MFRHFVLTTKTTQTRPQVFSVNGSIICQFCSTIDVITLTGETTTLSFLLLFYFHVSMFLSVSMGSYFKSSTTDLTHVPQFHSTLHVCEKTYDQTPHNDRFCPVCNSGMIEDEFHFLLHCPKYSI